MRRASAAACRENQPQALARLVDWKMTLKELALRMRCSRCGKKAAEVVAVARPRPWACRRILIEVDVAAHLRAATQQAVLHLRTQALYLNTTGNYNTASGFAALYVNTTGSSNSALGMQALYNNTTGTSNSASGTNALYTNSTGNNNTAVGVNALLRNKGASNNTAAGYQALQQNATGNYNTATGALALHGNTIGIHNVAVGAAALQVNTSGSTNIAVGYGAGAALTTGSSNIDIGAGGAAGESGRIRIGTTGAQTATFIAGINGSVVTGAAVYVTTAGQLGVLASSERYKTKVTSMGSSTEKLGRLRPVSFHLKSDPKARVQYGLIAEEVDKVYPELVIRGQRGEIEGVRYEELTPMLLNELQQQHRRLAEQQGQLAEQQAELQDMRSQLADLRRAMQERTH